MVIGNKKQLDEHAALMLKFPDMEHDEPYMVHVPPGKPALLFGHSITQENLTLPA